MLDKTISALSGVFIGSPGSTFTEDILRSRRGWGTAASGCDEYLCQEKSEKKRGPSPLRGSEIGKNSVAVPASNIKSTEEKTADISTERASKM
nr:O-fucosyltransferase 36-like [Tanacetum cinerariifolium]